ncbi:RNA polymerase sigma factor [Parafilimonas sp.]|uniref:RNA polymerase sigma factor n=1 Tax=Parafilimonas sp. TaxID=1969739 RepID=UPI0039E49FE1
MHGFWEDDDDLVKQFSNGDAAAAKFLFESYYRGLCYYAEKLIADRQTAQDIAVDCFIKLLKKKEDFASLRDIKSFLYTAARNSCIDHLRALKRHEGSHREMLYISQNTDAFDSENLITAEVMEALHRQIEKLPQKCGEVFKLIYFKKYSTQQVAGMLNITPKTVLNQKAKAIKILKAALLKNELLVLLSLIKIFR